MDLLRFVALVAALGLLGMALYTHVYDSQRNRRKKVYVVTSLTLGLYSLSPTTAVLAGTLFFLIYRKYPIWKRTHGKHTITGIFMTLGALIIAVDQHSPLLITYLGAALATLALIRFQQVRQNTSLKIIAQHTQLIWLGIIYILAGFAWESGSVALGILSLIATAGLVRWKAYQLNSHTFWIDRFYDRPTNHKTPKTP